MECEKNCVAIKGEEPLGQKSKTIMTGTQISTQALRVPGNIH